MRTTLTLDDDVAKQLESQLADKKRTMKDVINQALRIGLRSLEKSADPQEKFETEPASLAPRIDNVDNIAELLGDEDLVKFQSRAEKH